MAITNEIAECLIKGQAPKVKELVQAALDQGIAPGTVLSEGLIAGMNVIGERFKKNEIYVPEVLIAARAMKMGMEVLKPKLAAAGVEPIGKVVIGTVKGDLHDIGKNLVAMMLEGAGFQVIDCGIDCPAEKFIKAAQENGAAVIAMSALLTTTMPAMKQVIEALAAQGLKGKVKTMIGGAPVTQNYADEIGADGYSADAASAVDLAKALLRN